MKKHKKRNVIILCSVLVVLGLVAYLADNGDSFVQGIRDGMSEAQNQK